MAYLSFFSRLYSRLYYPYNPICNFLLAQIRKFIRFIANKILPFSLSKPNYGTVNKMSNVIVSLTSFPARIKNVWMVVESIKNQNYLPEKIVLWLSKEQFPSDDSIPQSLKDRIDDRFEIKMVDGDLRSHKKYYYAFQQYPDKIVITVDDDVFYHPDMVKYLYEDHKIYPASVITNIASRPIYDEGKIIPYKRWRKIYDAYDSNNLVQIGIGGVLYPPRLISPMVFDKELISELAPFADDLWLNAVLRLSGIPVIKSSFKYLPLGIKSDAPTLSSYNRHSSGNDIQIDRIRNYFMKTYGIDPYNVN